MLDALRSIRLGEVLPAMEGGAALTVSDVDWPDVTFMGVHAQTDARWSALREVEPLFSRQPYQDWCRIFRFLSEVDPMLDWQGAGFARCSAGEVDAVVERFRSTTDQTNQQFRTFLAEALHNDLSAAQDLIAIEGSAGASEDGGSYRCGFSSQV